MKKLFDIDCIGMCASVLCLIHCLALPWLVAIAGVYFGSFFESPNFHNIMLVVAILIGLPVFIISFIKYKSKLILVTGIVGLSLTTLGTIKSDNCCPPVSAEAVCEDSACEDSACEETVCEVDSECSEECEEEGITEEVASEDISADQDAGFVMNFNTVPLGVTLLIFAHFLNFRKRKSCVDDCCS